MRQSDRTFLVHEQVTNKHGLTRFTTSWGEAITFPLIIFFVLGHGANTQMSFCPEIPKIGTFATLDVHNFVCKPPIEMNFEEKL